MKKVLSILVIVLVVIYAAYIVLMAMFEGPLRIDLTNHVQLSVEDQTITLPWYMCVGTTYYGKIDGIDLEGRKYTRFLYDLPEVFESAELNCTVCWETKQVIAFVGDTRAISANGEAFPEVIWDKYYSLPLGQ